MNKNLLRKTSGQPEVIVSMTSFPARIKIAHRALQSLLDQIVKPDRIVLCLARDEFPGGRDDLPSELLQVIDQGVELLWAECNLKPHKKYFYTMRQYPDAVVITADDDKVYPQSFVGELVASYRRFPKCVSAFRAHLMTFGSDGELMPYFKWKNSCSYFINRPNLALFAVGAGGILYPPHLLPENLFDEDGLLSTTLNNDDIWLKIMEVANRIPVVIPSAAGDRAVTIDGSQESALYNANKDGNDGMIRAAWNYFSDAFGGSVSEIIREGRLTPVPEDIDHAISECHGVQQLLSVQKSRANKAISDYHTVQEQLKQEKNRTAKLTADMAQCVEEKNVLVRTKEATAAEVVKLREQLERAATERAELAKSKAAVEAEAARQRGLLEQATAERAELAKAKAAVEEDLVRQKAQGAKLEEGNRALSDRLAALTKKVNRAVSDYAKMKTWYQRVKQDYEKLSKAKLGRLTLRYWRLKDGLKARIKGIGNAEGGGVSVVIPTYKRVAWLNDAVQSVLSQKSARCGVQVLVCVNGPDKGYYGELQNQYAGVKDVEVLYTSKIGANAGRNIGIKAARKDFIAFLDCDDMLTPGYFKSMVGHFADPAVNIVIGRLEDLDIKSGNREKNTYVNSAMSRLGMGAVTVDKATPFLSSFCMKVYRTQFMRDQLGGLDEGERHTEDVLFWARNFNRITGRVFISNPDSTEAYVRRLTENSLSRPSDLNRFDFFIVDRLAILDVLQDILLNCARTIPHKDFVLSRLKAQTAIMKRFFDAQNEEVKQKARVYIQNSRNLFLNQALFSDVEAIAFCHNFAPTVDASAFVATKRLRDIDREEGVPLRWHVISQDMSKIRAADAVFKRYYADFAYAEHVVLHEPFGFAPATQLAFAKVAVEAAEKMPVPKVIYSRALFVGSHMAAYEYKKAHPEVKWYAEFSDPHAYGVDNEPRPCPGTPTWFDIEQLVYELADVILFTNQNQMEYMLAYNPHPDLNDDIRARACVMHHPVLPHEYCKLVQSEYRLDDTKINVGFFGTFYVTRKCDDLLLLLENKQVVLHIFTTKPEDLKDLVVKYGSQIRVNNTISQFEFLNLGSRLDYLVLTDTEFPGEINPFLPSKFADYLTTGTPIIAKVQRGSVLAEENAPCLIKISEVMRDFAIKLGKRRPRQ